MFDRKRPISSGASEVRSSQFRLASLPLRPVEKWGDDTPGQALEATSWTAPAPVDLLSMHHYVKPDSYNAAEVREWLKTAGERAAALKHPLFLGEFGMLVKWVRTPEDFDDAAYRSGLMDLFQAIFASHTALAAYWAFAPDSRPFVGTVGPEYQRFDYVMDLIAEYNRKCALQEGL